MVRTSASTDQNSLEWAVALSKAALESSAQTLERSRQIARQLGLEQPGVRKDDEHLEDAEPDGSKAA